MHTMVAKEGKHPGGRPRKFTSVEQMQTAIDAYFALCDIRTRQVVTGSPNNRRVETVMCPTPYTIQGLTVALGLTRDTLCEYESRPEFSDTVKDAKSKCEANKVLHMLDGDGYGPGYIFDLKNNHGWKDQQQIEHSGAVHVHFDKRYEDV